MGSGAHCTICNHKSVSLINDMLNAGKPSQRQIATMFGVGRDAIRRHIEAQHDGVKVQGSDEAEETTPSAVAEEKTPRQALEALIKKLEAQVGDGPIRSDVARELRIAYNDLAKMTAPDAASAISRVSDLEDWNDFATMTFKALEPFPEARKALDAAWARWYEVPDDTDNA